MGVPNTQYRVMKSAVDEARNGKGPVLVEAKTYRMHGFSTSDGGGYQREADLAYWRKKDPIDIGEVYLKRHKLANATEIKKMKNAARAEVDEAVAYALSAAEPDAIPLPEALFKETA